MSKDEEGFKKLIDKAKERIAKTSVGASTVRGQTKGTVAEARKYLIKNINLEDFVNPDNFQNMLDKHTEILFEKLKNLYESAEKNKKRNPPSWGLARKVLNIFLFEAAHNTILNRKYNLEEKIIPYLEVPLDYKNAERLKKHASDEDIELRWTNIKSLNDESSIQEYAKFQEYAKKCALREEYNCKHRCYLELYWFRRDE